MLSLSPTQPALVTNPNHAISGLSCKSDNKWEKLGHSMAPQIIFKCAQDIAYHGFWRQARQL